MVLPRQKGEGDKLMTYIIHYYDPYFNYRVTHEFTEAELASLSSKLGMTPDQYLKENHFITSYETK